MSTVVLIRHGQSTSNAAGTLAGRSPGIELDETGQSQAMTVGERLRGLPITAAVRSPILRCQQTLELALESAGVQVPIHVDERLTEADYGEWTGKLLKDLAKEPLWEQVQRSPSTVVFPGGEAMAEMRTRACGSIADWTDRFGEDAVWLLVSHADPIKTILAGALGSPFDEFQRIVIDPGSVSIIHFPPPRHRGEEPKPLVICINSTAGQVRQLVPTKPAAPQPGGGLGSGGDAPPDDLPR